MKVASSWASRVSIRDVGVTTIGGCGGYYSTQASVWVCFAVWLCLALPICYTGLLQRCSNETEGRSRDPSSMHGLEKNACRKLPSISLLCAAIALGKPKVCVLGFVHQGVRSAHVAASCLGCNSSEQPSSSVRSAEARRKTRRATRDGGWMSSYASPTEINSENARCEDQYVHILWARSSLEKQHSVFQV